MFCEDSEIDVNEPVAAPSAETASSFKELSQMDVRVCGISEIDIPTEDVGVYDWLKNCGINLRIKAMTKRTNTWYNGTPCSQNTFRANPLSTFPF